MVSARGLLVGALVVATVAPAAAQPGAAGVAAPATVGGTTDAAAPEPAGVAAQQTDNTVTRIAVRADGDARWTVRVRTRLDTEEDVEDYRAFQERFRNDTDAFLGPFADRIRGVVAEAVNETGREMTATNFSASTSIQEVPRRWGVVSFSFRWSNFARAEGGTLVVGDVFEGGFFLAANDSLVVETPPGYAVDRTDPDPDANETDAVTWTGRRDFPDGRPRVVLAPARVPTDTPTPTEGQSGDLPLGALAVAAAVVAAVAALLVVRTSRGGRGGGRDRLESKTGDSGGGSEMVLTDPERVERLLAERGGRTKQAAIADELGWSASKTSRVVGGMVEDGRVEKLRVGRENVVDLVEDSERREDSQ